MSADATSAVPELQSERVPKPQDNAKSRTGTIEFRVLSILLTALLLWGAAIAVFGYPALIVVALALVPTMFFLLFMITVGK